MEVIAKIVKCLEPQAGVTKDGKEWKKVSVLVRYGEYDDRMFEMICWRNIEDFDRLPMHTPIRFYFDLNSREFNGRYYTEAIAHHWEIIKP